MCHDVLEKHTPPGGEEEDDEGGPENVREGGRGRDGMRGRDRWRLREVTGRARREREEIGKSGILVGKGRASGGKIRTTEG